MEQLRRAMEIHVYENAGKHKASQEWKEGVGGKVDESLCTYDIPPQVINPAVPVTLDNVGGATEDLTINFSPPKLTAESTKGTLNVCGGVPGAIQVAMSSKTTITAANAMGHLKLMTN